MDTLQIRRSSQQQTQVATKRPDFDEDPRRALLAGMPVKERRIDLAGVSTAILEGGDGPPVVLLHGPGEHAAKWMTVVPDLVKTHRVIAPDLPAHGISQVMSGSLNMGRVLGWVGDLIEHTCSEPPVVVGQIIGGAIAARFASEQRAPLRHLVLVDSLGISDFKPTPEFGAALMQFVSDPSDETHDRLWQHCAYDFDRLQDRLAERWKWLKAYNLDRAQLPGLKEHQQSLMEQFGFPAIPPTDLERITTTTTLIWGRHDLATQLPIAEAASKRYGWPLLVIEDAADDPPLEQPEAFLEALYAALRA